MKKALQFFACPGVPYPLGAVAHATLGAGIGCLPPQFFDAVAYTPVAGAQVGALVGVAVGLVAWLVSK